MITAEGTGKNIEKAIENALFELKASREDVDIKIINEGGLFKKAKVIVSISEDARDKYEKKERKVKDDKPKTKQVDLEKEGSLINSSDNAEKEKTENNVKENVSLSDTATKKGKITENEFVETAINTLSSPRTVDREKVVDPKLFLEGFFKVINRDVEIEDVEDEKYRCLSVKGEDVGDIIGHHGEGFYALNRLISVMNGHNNKKILLDIGGYREKRVQSLTDLAKRIANKVAASGRYSKLNPMTPADRRIIHTTLADDSRVTTLSKGTEPNRYVIIFPKDED